MASIGSFFVERPTPLSVWSRHDMSSILSWTERLPVLPARQDGARPQTAFGRPESFERVEAMMTKPLFI
jgi:hypothetical protein